MSNAYLKQVEWKRSEGLVPYAQALEFMEGRVTDIIAGKAPPCIWFLEHPPLYTRGTSADEADMLDAQKFPVYEAGRGGEYTYHGPGQLIAYCMLDLKQLFAPEPTDLRAYIKMLEQWIIAALAEFGIRGELRERRVGVWVNQGSGSRNQASAEHDLIPDSRFPIPDIREAKIAAIGVRVRKWVAYHGISINLHPDLSHYAGIVPCGIKEFGVTSMREMGVDKSIMQMCELLRQTPPFGGV